MTPNTTYPTQWLQDVWTPSGRWRVAARGRNWLYLPRIAEGWAATVQRVSAGDEKYAEAYAKWTAHYAIIYLKGLW